MANTFFGGGGAKTILGCPHAPPVAESQKCTIEWVEEHIREDVCRLSSKLTSTTDTQIESSWTSQIVTKRASCIGLGGEPKLYTQLRSFLKSFSQVCILKEKQGPDVYKNVKCPEILNPNWQWTLNYQM